MKSLTANDLTINSFVELSDGTIAKITDISWCKVYIKKSIFGVVTSLDVSIKDQKVEGIEKVLPIVTSFSNRLTSL